MSYKRLIALTALACSPVLAGGIAASQAQTKLRFGHDQTVGSMYDEGHQALKRIAAEKSGGQIDIAVFPAAQLGT
jgi:TRAP-type C4-dicarboxylate transport system substrate-binding protein